DGRNPSMLAGARRPVARPHLDHRARRVVARVARVASREIFETVGETVVIGVGIARVGAQTGFYGVGHAIAVGVGIDVVVDGISPSPASIESAIQSPSLS